MVGIENFVGSWLRLRQIWLLSHAHSDPLAHANDTVTSLEDALRKRFVELLNTDGKDAERLFALARSVRDKHVGTRIDMRAAIDVGNVCRVNCHYCPMRRDNLHGMGKNSQSTISPYRATSKKIVEVAEYAYQLGFRELFLQSGKTPVSFLKCVKPSTQWWMHTAIIILR